MGYRADNETELMDFISHNFIRLNILLDKPTVTLQTDAPTQQLISVLAQWCGALGFWLGLSAMTVAEILELSIALVRRRPTAAEPN